MNNATVTANSQVSCPPSIINNGDTSTTIVSLNVGGQEFSTLLSTLIKHPKSWFAQTFITLTNNGTIIQSAPSKPICLPKDSENRYFIDRDGYLFQYVLDYLRTDKLLLPESFPEFKRLKREFDFYKLPYSDIVLENGDIPSVKSVALRNWEDKSKTIMISYQGSFAFGRDGLVDVKFRKLYRILIAGHASLCRWVFEDTLNDSRDPERCSEDRYSSRFFLRHNNLEQAFDTLIGKGFGLVGCCSSGTHAGTGEPKPSHHLEESRWQHYNEFVFTKQAYSAPAST